MHNIISFSPVWGAVLHPLTPTLCASEFSKSFRSQRQMGQSVQWLAGMAILDHGNATFVIQLEHHVA